MQQWLPRRLYEPLVDTLHSAPGPCPLACRQCENVLIEGQQAVFLLPASCRGHAEDTALASMLLRPEALWRRLELRLLEGALVELPPCFGEDAGGFGLLPPRRAQLDLQAFVQASAEPTCLPVPLLSVTSVTAGDGRGSGAWSSSSDCLPPVATHLPHAPACLQTVRQLGRGGVRASLRREPCSIFQQWVLVLERL